LATSHYSFESSCAFTLAKRWIFWCMHYHYFVCPKTNGPMPYHLAFVHII